MGDIGFVFLIIIAFFIIYLVIKVCCLMCCGPAKENNSNESSVRRRVIQSIRIEPTNVAGTTTTTAVSATTGAVTTNTVAEDRQGNIFTIANETTNNQLPHRCTDFYYVEPSAEDAARIRAQLEKDEKDLPTYEEVMAMSLAEANGSTLAPPPTITTSSTSVATADTVVSVPPYSEADRNVLPAVHQPSNSGTTTWSTPNATGGAGAASTSRAAAAAATNTPATILTIANSVSNTSV